MTYTLNTIILEPLSKNKPKNAVILCHGYGGDGKDISILANYWRAHLPDTIFLCPDAPERCAASPSGFQWFDLLDQSQEQILSKSLIAEKKLNKFIDEVKDNNGISAEKISLSGFIFSNNIKSSLFKPVSSSNSLIAQSIFFSK